MKHADTIQQLEQENLCLKTQVKHLNNDLMLTRQEYEATINSYFDIYSNMERKVKKRTLALDRANQKLQDEINDRKRAEAQLLHMDKMTAIGTLAGGISHDFNNILAAIMGYTELALLEVDGKSRLEHSLTQVYKASQRARDLVAQILTFSRQSETEMKPVDIVPVVKESLRLLRASLPATIEIKINISTRLRNIMADPTQLHQIMMNLCTNAGHAMQEKGGLLQIDLDDICVKNEPGKRRWDLLPGDYIRLRVKDTGHGIPPEVLKRIFEPYFSTKKRGDGTGLGLAVVHGIMKTHGGKIKVKSQLGQGTAFQLFFPSIEAAQTMEQECRQPISTGTEQLLLVDDEKSVLDSSEQLLERLGYHVVARSSSVEALEAFRYQPDLFDLIITDQTMPNMTGIELAGEMLTIRPDLPIILCTGFSEAVGKDHAVPLGIREVLMKPVALHDFADSIRRAMGQPGSVPGFACA